MRFDGPMPIRQPGFGHPRMLRRVGDGTGFVVQGGQWGLVVRRDQHAQVMNALGATHLLGQVGQQVQPVVTREQAGVQHEPGQISPEGIRRLSSRFIKALTLTLTRKCIFECKQAGG